MPGFWHLAIDPDGIFVNFTCNALEELSLTENATSYGFNDYPVVTFVCWSEYSYLMETKLEWSRWIIFCSRFYFALINIILLVCC